MTIQVFKPLYRTDEVLAEIRECLDCGWTGAGYKTVAFENAWKAYTGLPHAHFLNSATAGLHLAVALLKDKYGWQDGDEIITTPLTFVSTNHVILQGGLCPVFADVDETLCLDPEAVNSRITRKTRAVMFVGLGGNTGQLTEIAKLCHKRGLLLILDAAHMAGTRLNGAHVGQEADVTVFSFQAVKNLATADSGMVCFQDSDLDAKARQWAWLGINKDTYTRSSEGGNYKWEYDVEAVGFKYNGNSIMAAMALVGLKYLDEDNAMRRQIADIYDAALSEFVQRVPMAKDCTPSRHLYQIVVEQRNAVLMALYERGIYPGVHYRDNTEYRMYTGNCPRARWYSERLISLPLHLHLTSSDVSEVAATVLEAVERVATH
jgi:dTDP-4-amino-4,6-dideoxygalactose transaminase